MNPHKSDATDQLAAALAAAQGEMRCPLKDTSNPHFKSTYADLAGVREAVTGPLSQHGLAIMQTVVACEPQRLERPSWSQDRGEYIAVFHVLGHVRTVLLHSSGQWIAGEQPLVCDWTDPQKVGSALTYARRYGLAAICGIAQTDDDAEAALGRPTAAPAATPKQAPRQEPNRAPAPTSAPARAQAQEPAPAPESIAASPVLPDAPRTGKALYAWLCDQGDGHTLRDWVAAYGPAEFGFPRYVSQWSKGQVEKIWPSIQKQAQTAGRRADIAAA